jgi:hypothetical protein
MNRKRVSCAVFAIALVSFAVMCVAATSHTVYTPLYTVRMEQQSSTMNFLPTEKATFTYAAEKGYNLSSSAGVGCIDVAPLSTSPASTCNPSCFDTCEFTCEWTCFETCGYTCPDTCRNTCPNTCEGWTCDYLTCPITCACCSTSGD